MITQNNHLKSNNTGKTIHDSFDETSNKKPIVDRTLYNQSL